MLAVQSVGETCRYRRLERARNLSEDADKDNEREGEKVIDEESGGEQ